jgi:ABC-2 type transport system permease protein
VAVEEASPAEGGPGAAPRAIRATSSTVRVVSAESRLGERLASIWRSRELLTYLVRSEIKVKYKNSALGLLWTMIAPALTLTIYALVFGTILQNRMPYFVIYLASGLLVWNFFSGSVVMGTGVIVGRAGIVKKVAFPREILAIATVRSQLVYLGIQGAVLALFLLVFLRSPDWTALPLLVVALAAVFVLASALAVLLSAVNVYFRDAAHLIEVAMMAWFWATPIVYSYQAQIAPHFANGQWSVIHALYFANPMTTIIMGFQRVIYGASPQLPGWSLPTYYAAVGTVLALSIGLFIVAVTVFGRLEGNFAEEL